ncbi:hypothetical protein MPTK1_4g16400 [Marchantia polymorpha subsp. ruderalis]|uniref:Uncharacterized protein n=2 Tax=Marchantia polymorpha TaxID=3197 RepID=A0AAF6BAI1_MARPO|nr:hypothetical protein MARPO_0054s0105 [Marchantia polymorpha]BBN09015.1 hypothetical protein Mp_4g16400 [Marchantia polymorpha subsp. ruderalis]|eukprot:PTQ38004.1 hypothetical protein MARPO_0054s0105 [Marchantia polymorpha]
MAVIYGSCKTAVLPSFFYQALDSPPPQRRNSTPFAHSPKFARRAFMSLGLSLFMSGQSWEAQAIEDVGLKNGQLRSCDGATPCVSTSAFRSPSRFMPPWSYLNSKDKAYDELLKALQRMGAQIVVKDDDTYIYATIAQPNDVDDVDDLEFLFVGKQVCYRSRSRKNAPDPPFCWWPGCINGPKNRGRMERLRDELGWIPMETDEEKVWVPLLLH